MIPDTTLYTGAIGIFTTLAVVSAGISIRIWQHSMQMDTSSLVSDAIDRKTERLERRTADFVRPVIEKLFLLADGGVLTEEDVTDHLSTSIERTELSVAEIESLLRMALAVRRPPRLARELHTAYKWSYGGFAFVSLGSLGCAITIFAMATAGLEFSLWPPDLWDIPILTIGSLTCASLYVGIRQFKRGNRLSCELKQEAKGE